MEPSDREQFRKVQYAHRDYMRVHMQIHFGLCRARTADKLIRVAIKGAKIRKRRGEFYTVGHLEEMVEWLRSHQEIVNEIRDQMESEQ